MLKLPLLILFVVISISSNIDARQRKTTERPHYSRRCIPHTTRAKKNTTTSNKNKIKTVPEYITVKLSGISLNIPSSWQLINDKEHLPARIEAIFIGNNNSLLTPTINIATENASISQELYVKNVIEYHTKDNTTLRSSFIGSLNSKSGAFDLIQTEKTSSFGNVCFIQGIILHGNKAFVITATSLKDELSNISKVIFKAINSFEIEDQHIQEEAQSDVITHDLLNEFKNDNN